VKKNAPHSTHHAVLITALPTLLAILTTSAQARSQASATAEAGLAGGSAGFEADTPDPHAETAAHPVSETGFEWGLKLAFEWPLGDADGGVSVLGEQARSGALRGIGGFRVPIALDLGYRTSRSWWLGVEAGAGLGPAGDDCVADTECEWSSVRLGAQAIYQFEPGASTEPWLGAILGYEWLRGSVTRVLTVGGEDYPIKARELLGGPLLSVEGGLQFELADALRVGPYVSGTGGVYLTDSFDCIEELGCPDDGSVDDKRVHFWVGLGVRGTHGP
jgi:hypothetical protein